MVSTKSMSYESMLVKYALSGDNVRFDRNTWKVALLFRNKFLKGERLIDMDFLKDTLGDDYAKCSGMPLLFALKELGIDYYFFRVWDHSDLPKKIEYMSRLANKAPNILVTYMLVDI